MPPHCPVVSWCRSTHSMARAIARRRHGRSGRRPSRRSAASTARKTLRHVTSSRERAKRRSGAVGEQQRERDHRGARPARHGVDVERAPRGEQHELDRHHRHALPGELPEEREPDAREDPGAHEPPARADELARAHERGLVGAVAGELEGEVRLGGGREMARAAGIERPAPVGLLEREQPLGETALGVGLPPAQDAVEEDVLGLHRGIRLERRLPVALRMLTREQPRVRAPALASAAATRAGSGATTTTAPPPPPPVSLAPSAPARRAAAISASVSAEETPSAASTAWFASNARPRAARSPASAACTPASTIAAISSKRRSWRAGSAAQRARSPPTAAAVLRGRSPKPRTSGSGAASVSRVTAGGSPLTKRKHTGPSAAAAGSTPEGCPWKIVSSRRPSVSSSASASRRRARAAPRRRAPPSCRARRPPAARSAP